MTRLSRMETDLTLHQGQFDDTFGRESQMTVKTAVTAAIS